jgi:cytochrome c-type biogenesis protein CcmF
MSDIGAYALRFALLISIAGFGAGLYAGVARRPSWTRVAERSVGVLFAFATLALIALFSAFASNDYQLSYVASHSARSMGIQYRLAALWGGQAGSLLLWLWMLAAYGAACVAINRHQNRALMPWVSAVLQGNAVFFLVLLVFVTDPFEKLPPGHVMSDGSGLNPLLQHPAMMIHPVLLYTGLVGFVVPFAFAFAALASGELGTPWVLGWGGYWAWDPVENASFMPWLAATAYLHSVMIQEKRDMLKAWNLLLIGLTYTLCLFGTFLTRSGIVQSVHAFAQTPLFTSVFLGYVLFNALVCGAALWTRRDGIRSPNKIESMISREASFLLNNWVFVALLMVVFWGTMFPVFSEAVTGDRIAVGPKFFNTMAGPLALLLLLLTGVGPLIAWRRATPANLRRQFVWPALTALATGLLVAALVGSRLTVYSLAAWSLGGFVAATIVQEYTRAIRARTAKGQENALQAFGALLRKNQQRYGGYIVHLGAVLVLMGTTGSVLNEESLENVEPGAEMQIHDYRLRYLTARPIPEQHYGGAVARIALYRGDEPLAVMAPEKRMYWLEQQPASIPSVYSTLREDVYVILTAIEADGSATLKVYRNPLVNWIWIGGAIFVVDTLAVMWPHPGRVPQQERA